MNIGCWNKPAYFWIKTDKNSGISLADVNLPVLDKERSLGFSEAAPEGNSSHQKVQKISEGKYRIRRKNRKPGWVETEFEASRFSHNGIAWDSDQDHDWSFSGRYLKLDCMMSQQVTLKFAEETALHNPCKTQNLRRLQRHTLMHNFHSLWEKVHDTPGRKSVELRRRGALMVDFVSSWQWQYWVSKMEFGPDEKLPVRSVLQELWSKSELTIISLPAVD